MELNTANESRSKLSKTEKKFLRKQAKARNTLLRHEGIESVSHVTQSLVVANGGLGNGVGRNQLLRILEKCGSVEALLMPPNKPYSFVTYGAREGSRTAYDTLNGQEMVDDFGQNITLYLNYVEKVYWKDQASSALPPGLLIVEEVVSPEEEKMLLEGIDWAEDARNQNAQKSLKHRRVKHFGYEFRYDNNNVDKDKPLPGGLPEMCGGVLERCLKQGHIKISPDQLTINQYEPGQGIPPHIDTHSAFEDEIISLSLGAEIVMDFKHPDGRTMAVLIPRRSLLVMTGECRYLWTHGITPRKLDVIQASEGQKCGIITGDVGDLTLSKRGVRTSFTFRKVRQTPCACAYPSVCDSQGDQPREASPSFPENDRDAAKLEEEYVHRVYDKIAGHFSSTRHTPWPRIVAFLKTLPQGAIVADVGCGNGKYLGVNKELYTVGCDRSQNLLEICGEKQFQAFVCDALAVPIRSGACDACISIAVIHHFATAERRLATLRELARLLRPGGKALVSVWAMEQEYNEQKSKYLRGNRNGEGEEEQSNGEAELLGEEMPDSGGPEAVRSVPPAGDLEDEARDADRAVRSKLPVHTNRTCFHSQDLLVPWHLKGGGKSGKGAEASKPASDPGAGPVFHRYYHVFCEGELEGACRTLTDVRVEQSYYDQGNWCVIFTKL
ncbi:alkylated DNA repair protein alkB homolog 8 isoform X1 [Ornithorhynchus anatinus]|uniref:tRNA (carboxymethyluridine(34)-5-O)-methyltransferase ALKBH8 n=2 Tax=Ornithorhynchus anatinus TaxID=9258 RepID=F6SFX6_ORNAN|nr:alkylated DNA repair protein alkB homolog 8 isoform X1 [Ornithorhynchus anatinus]XP_028904009.1 alkylated DNA repair protein alkB homolog 8 isoform X1 [Ornithorhynchus anatinus]XP_028904010.1 alkylated DNA repair protein alkB homolog 8 isoform X1 [Ornithorhynchus anatinus]